MDSVNDYDPVDELTIVNTVSGQKDFLIGRREFSSWAC